MLTEVKVGILLTLEHSDANHMASPFQRYQGGIEASTGNLVPAYGQMAQMTAGAIAGFGKSIADGLQKYQENVQKDQILTQEAEMLGDQIMAFKKQFDNNPEYAPFAQSLQPHIDKLSKVPTMSLAQKMGTVTGVKAAFANISPMLQAFEANKASMLQQDMNKARQGVVEFDTVTVPTAIVAEGKMPYFYNKSYQENEAALVELAKQAQAKGAKIDIPSVVQKWREETKAGAMANNKIPPAIKEGLIKQIDSAKGISERAALVEKAQKEGRGLTMEEAGQLFQGERVLSEDASARTSVKSQLEAKAEAEKAPAKTEKVLNEREELAQRRSNMLSAIEALKNNPEVQNNVKFYERQVREADKRLGQIAVAETASKELSNIDQLIEKADEAIKNEDTTNTAWYTKVSDAIEKGVFDKINSYGIKEQARIAIDQGFVDKVTPDYAKRLVKDLSGGMGGFAILGSIITPDIGNALGIKNKARDLTVEEERNIEGALNEFRSKQGISKAVERKDANAVKAALVERKNLLQQQVETGRLKPSMSEIAAATPRQQEQAKAGLPEELAVTNLGAFSMGSRTEQVQRSIDDKRRDMATYFQNKYGYIPSGFEASFKAIYPEANFKTMETPYGAFMYDGKEWKQIATPTPAKPRTAKEIGEEKSYIFGQMRADGTQEFKEFLPNSGVYMRGVFSGSEKEKQDFRERMYAATRAKRTVGRLIEINDMLGESMPWNASVQGEAKALLPEIMAALRPEIVGVGTVSNYEQEMIRDVVADPTKFFSLESSDRAKLLVIASRIDRTLAELPSVYDIEVKVAGQSNAEREKILRTQMYANPKSRREQEYEKTGKVSWN